MAAPEDKLAHTNNNADEENSREPSLAVITNFEELQHKIDRDMVRRLTHNNARSLRDTTSCVCCGCNFARAFELQASFVRLFARRENYSSKERKFLTQGDLIAWTTASVGCDPAIALEKLEDIRQTYRRLHLIHNQQCSVCLHRPDFHAVQMAGTDLQKRPVIFSAFDPSASFGLPVSGLPSYLTHLFNCIGGCLRFLPPTQHGVCLFFDCDALGPEHYTVETVSSVAEMLKLLPCRVAYAMLCRIKYLHRRLLIPLLYLTGLEDRVIFLSDDLSRVTMRGKLKQLFPESLAVWLANRCVDED